MYIYIYINVMGLIDFFFPLCFHLPRVKMKACPNVGDKSYTEINREGLKQRNKKSISEMKVKTHPNIITASGKPKSPFISHRSKGLQSTQCSRRCSPARLVHMHKVPLTQEMPLSTFFGTSHHCKRPLTFQLGPPTSV